MHEIAAQVAERLGFTLVDEAIITRAAGEAGVDPHVVADVEKRQTFMARLLDALSSSSDATGHAFSGVASVYSPSGRPDDRGSPRPDPRRDRGDIRPR